MNIEENTGSPWLLLKAVAKSEIATARLPGYVLDQIDDAYRRRRLARLGKDIPTVNTARRPAAADNQESPVKKSKLEKTAAASLRKSMKHVLARRSLQKAIAEGENDAMQNIRRLEREVAKGAGWQESAGTAFLLNRERASLAALERVRKASTPGADSFASYDSYMADPNGPARAESAASRAQTQRTISNVQANPVNAPRRSQVGVLQDVRDGTGMAAHLATSDLPSQVEIHKLEKALADAKTPQEREAAGYVLTRASLLRAHMLGEA